MTMKHQPATPLPWTNGASMKRLFTITVRSTVPPASLHELDRLVGQGFYYVECNSEDEALDRFHETVPIKVLDDFDISVSEGVPQPPINQGEPQ